MSTNNIPSNPNNPNKKSRKGLIVILLALFLIIATAVTIFMFLPANISRQEAQEIAIAHVGGGISNRPERDFERFQRVWYVEVFRDDWVMYEVYVSMRTGEIVKAEIGTWD